MPVKQPAFPRFTLNCTPISVVVGSRSPPDSALASAAGYHVPGTLAPAKSAKSLCGPPSPSTAELSSQLSAFQVTSAVMAGTLSRVAPHLLAAAWTAISLCCPSVVPELPPTGDTGVGSLKPTPAGSPFWITTVAPPCTAEGVRDANANTRSAEMRRLDMGLLRLGSGLGRLRGLVCMVGDGAIGGVGACHALEGDPPIGLSGGDHEAPMAVVPKNPHGAAG